jgi:hypothetical protein
MPDRRAADLAKGDRLQIAGVVWTVTKAKSKGKLVKLAVESRRGSFERLVEAKATYTVVDGDRPGPGNRGSRPTQERARPGSERPSGPLLNDRGAMTRWAEPKDLTPPAEPRKADPWEKVSAADRVVIEELGAKLVGVEVEGGKLVVPPVTDATIFGHLLTMHGIRYDGATMAEAKAWAREHDLGGSKTAEQVLGILDFEKAYRIHDEIHGDLTAMTKPHWHREKAPR